MATVTPDSNSKARTAAPSKAGAEPKKPLLPPEPKFWKRYSPHHEFPLSVVSSIFLHVLVLGGLGMIITYGILGLLGMDRKVESDYVVIAGGGGNPLGIENGPGHAIPQGPEAIQNQQTPAQNPKPDVPPVEFNAKPEPPKLITEPKPDRFLELNKEASKSGLQEIGRRANEMQQASLAPRGKGGTGKGGGRGAGIGPGTGNDAGPGAGRINTKRQKRNERWILNFQFTGEDEYVHQLESLGAILAFPKGDGQYLVIRDLSRRPVHPEVEDIRKIDRIRWTSDRADGLEALSAVLGIRPAPPYFEAFFPIDFENLLRQREKERYSGDEDNIEWTKFNIVRRGGHYEPVVQSVKLRNE